MNTVFEDLHNSLEKLLTREPSDVVKGLENVCAGFSVVEKFIGSKYLLDEMEYYFLAKNLEVPAEVKKARIRFHQDYDLYVTPVLAFPPVKVGELQPKLFEKLGLKIINALSLGGLVKALGVVESLAIEMLSKTPFTQLANLTGQPAMSLPLHWTEDGLPSGTQFVAPFGEEALLFKLAAQLEQAQPWFDKRPGIVQ